MSTPWHAIRGIGNKLRHEYQKISEIILWKIIAIHSDGLKATIDEMIVRHSRPE